MRGPSDGNFVKLLAVFEEVIPVSSDRLGCNLSPCLWFSVLLQ